MTSLRSEFIAGLTTFATMAYIIVINPQILSKAGLDFEAVMVATILSSALATFLMGFYARMPFALAPGMGLNAYFTYGIVLEGGHTWQTALGIIFIAGLLVLLLNFLHLRALILESIPESIRQATITGIGLFLIFIGFQNISLITEHTHTLVGLGAVATPTIALAAIGIILMASLRSFRFESALLLGIIAMTFLGWLLGLTSFGSLVSPPPSLDPTFLQLDLARAIQPDCWSIILTFVFLALFDTAGTLYALSERSGFLKPPLQRILTCDAVGTALSGLLGSSPITIYLESAAGIAAGGRTGLTAIFVSLFFIMALFFSPLIAAIPLFATAPVLIIVGAMMLQSSLNIHWEDATEAIPSCIVVAAIPLSYSIADGIGLGFVTYPFIKLCSGRVQETKPLTWIIALFFLTKFIYL